MVGVVAHQRRHVEGGREAGLPVLEQVAEARVRLLGRAEAGELPHRPEPAAVHRRVDAARERIRPGVPEVAVVVDRARCPACRAARSRRPRSSRSARRRARGSSRTRRGSQASVASPCRGSWVAAMAVILGRTLLQVRPPMADNRAVKELGLLFSPSRSPRRCSQRAAAASRSPASAARRSCPRPRPRSSRSTATRTRRSGRTPTSSPSRFPGRQGRRRAARGRRSAPARTSTTRPTSQPALGPELDFVWLDLEQQRPERRRADAAEGRRRPSSAPSSAATCRTRPASCLYEQVDGWQVMSSDQASIDAFKARGRPQDGPVLADDESFSQAMDDYPDASIFKAYLSGKTVMDEMRKSLPARPGEVPRQGRQPRLDRGRAAHDLRRRPLRHDDPRHARQLCCGPPRAATRRRTSSCRCRSSFPADVLAYIGFHGAAGHVHRARRTTRS